MTDPLSFNLGDLLGLTTHCDYQTDDEVIEWLEGRLVIDRRMAWQAHAETCVTCAELIAHHEEFQKLTADGLTIPGEARAFSDRDTRIRRAIGLGSKPRKGWSPFYWLVPSVVLAIAALLMFWPSAVPLIEEVERFPLVPPPAVRGHSLAESWQRIEVAWAAGDYAAAESVLSESVVAHPESTDLAFYLGLSRLYTEDWSGAVDALRAADDLQAASPSENTRWALATALDRAGRREAACDMLESIESLDGKRAAQARGIVEAGCR